MLGSADRARRGRGESVSWWAREGCWGLERAGGFERAGDLERAGGCLG